MNIQLGLNKDFDKAKEIIYSYFPEKRVKIEEIDYKYRYFFNISLQKNRSLKDFYDKITNLILELILNIYSEDLISRYIDTHLSEYKTDEKREIGEISKKLLLDKESFVIEKQYINNKIKKYILDKPFISIDGFITFRLKDIDLFISLVIDKGIQEFTAKKEYRDFINVLKYFIDVQESKYDTVNVVFTVDDYILLDGNNKPIEKNFFEDIVLELNAEEISKEDLLISTLIVLAPSNLIVHLDQEHKDRDIVRVITDVFEDRVYFCLGCEKCKGELIIKNS
ncbi:MAG: hypothetical protein GX080_07090 [Tissierellia bacterium]|nr:hypothetical protein [Tissierellia bacterium]